VFNANEKLSLSQQRQRLPIFKNRMCTLRNVFTLCLVCPLTSPTRRHAHTVPGGEVSDCSHCRLDWIGQDHPDSPIPARGRLDPGTCCAPPRPCFAHERCGVRRLTVEPRIVCCWQGGRVVACTQPRRVAATTVAERVAQEMGSLLGEEVRVLRVVSLSTKVD
jgi:hypothetical protein